MDYRRIFELFAYQKARFPNSVALARRKSLKWETFSTEECLDYINRTSAGLLNLGLQQEDRIAILSPSGHPYWSFIDFGALQIGLVVVPIHASIQRKDLLYILKQAEIKYCFVANRELYKLVHEVKAEVKSLKKIFSFRGLPDTTSLEDIWVTPSAKHLETIQTFKAAIHEDDLATIIYTSGTSGNPKGVCLSHKNIISNIKAVVALIPITQGKIVLSFLPPSHIFERMVVYAYIAVGASVHFARLERDLLDTIQDLRPHYFTAVPLMIERFYEGIINKTTKGPNWKEDLVKWAIKIGKQYKGKKRMRPWYLVKLMSADLLVFRHWRKALGGRIDGVVVGGASMREDLSRLFCAAGIELREGYGLTETSPIVSFNRFEPGGHLFGTVGLPLPGVEVKIEAIEGSEPGGEILVKGPNVMIGYLHDDAANQAAFTEDAWFKTGDLGTFVHKKFLKITGRKKEIFKSGSGKYVVPQLLENRLHTNPYISQCMILGYNRPFLSALIYPNFDLLQNWCETNQVHWTAPQFMVINPKVLAFYSAQLSEINQELLPHEKIKSCQLFSEAWTIESGELTLTLKLRRQYIAEKYHKLIAEIYQDKG